MRLTSVLGLPVGLILGFLLEYRGFNMGTALRSILFAGPKKDLRAYVTILIINIVAVHVLAAAGLIRPRGVPFFWPAVVVGGFLFGLGMSFGAGCANIWHGTGTGASGLAFALLGFMFGTHVIRTPVFAPVFISLRRYVLELHGTEITLPTLLAPGDPLLQWAVVMIPALAGTVWLGLSMRRRDADDRSWVATGMLIGFTGVAAWLVSRVNGDTYGLSLTQPTLALGRIIFFGDFDAFYWGTFMILGIPIGVFFAARLKRTLHFRIPATTELLKLVGSGALTGVGASLAGGCNVGHGITGVSLLSVGSIAATAAAMSAVWLTSAIRSRFHSTD